MWEAVEEASGRDTQTLTLATGQRHGGAGQPHLVASAGPAASGVFWNLPVPVGGVVGSRISFVAYFDFNPSFRSFVDNSLKIRQLNKTRGICQI